jgi:hypothetical protein
VAKFVSALACCGSSLGLNPNISQKYRKGDLSQKIYKKERRIKITFRSGHRRRRGTGDNDREREYFQVYRARICKRLRNRNRFQGIDFSSLCSLVGRYVK